MKKIASVDNYDVFEVIKGDARRVRNMFSGPLEDAAYGDDATFMWESEVEPALKAIESGKEADYFDRYPYDDEDVADIDEWDKACMLHPLFVISAKDATETDHRNTLFIVPPVQMEAAYITDDGKYWGDDRWEPLPDILGDEELAQTILDEIYDYIKKRGTAFRESKRFSGRAAGLRKVK